MPSQFRQILSLLDRRARLRLAGLFVLMLGSALLEMAGLGMLLPFLQLVVDPAGLARIPFSAQALTLAGGRTEHLLLLVSIALIGFFFVKNAYLLAILWIQSRFSMHLMAGLSRTLLERVMAQPYQAFHRRNTAEMIRNIRYLVSVTFSKGLMPTLQLAMELTTAIGVLGLLMMIDPLSTLLVVGTLGLVMTIYFAVMRKRVHAWGEQAVQLEARIQLWLQQALGAFKELRLTGRAGHFVDTYGRHCAQRAELDARSLTAPSVPRLLLETVSAAGLVLVVISHLLQGRSPSEAIPTLGVFALAALRVAPSLSRLISAATLLKESAKAVGIVHHEFHALPAAGATERADRLPPIGRISLDGVGFTYADTAKPALTDITLSITRGQSLALVGRSGAGKTTLVDVILGLLPASSGSIAIDGQKLEAILAPWQRSVGYIPQSIYITDDSLRRNIALGVPDDRIDETLLAQACRQAQLDEVIAGLPHGLDTVVGERGARLSGGQRQRIGIARALYDDPQVLVLDEATSALDMETEHEITRAIDALTGAKTVIVIAHRLSTVRHCDAIVLMEDGRIADLGTFPELEARNPDFRRMVERSNLSAVPG